LAEPKLLTDERGRRGAQAPGVRLVAALAIAASALAVASVPASAADPVIATAGDIACAPGDAASSTACRQRQTSDLLVNAGLSAVLPLGDNQYDDGSLSNYRASYDPSWGRVKSITRPALGNHEPGSASGYFDYFNGSGRTSGPAGERGKGYYSFDVGTWHLIAINSNCARVSCSAGSAQERWLRADLASHPTACTLAYWHHPRFSSGHDGNGTFMQAIWQDLYDANANVVLVGHSHHYERFAPQNASGRLDRGRGIREFVVGTGGAFFTGVGSATANSEVRQNSTFGVLRLTLRPAGYDWKFAPEAGRSFTDSGSDTCHGRGSVTRPPPSPPLTSPPGPVSGIAPSPPAAVPANPDTDTGTDARTGPGPSGQAVTCTILGTEGRDLLKGSAGRDVICGLGGNDRIRGGAGDDLIVGGLGKDRLAGGQGSDRIYGNAGRDSLSGQSGHDRVVGGAGRDRIYGNAGNDTLRSRDRRPRDRVFGGRGYDRAWINAGDRVRRVERVFRR
jgi:Ca2+-binding RTX toxin-like protein